MVLDVTKGNNSGVALVGLVPPNLVASLVAVDQVVIVGRERAVMLTLSAKATFSSVETALTMLVTHAARPVQADHPMNVTMVRVATPLLLPVPILLLPNRWRRVTPSWLRIMLGVSIRTLSPRMIQNKICSRENRPPTGMLLGKGNR